MAPKPQDFRRQLASAAEWRVRLGPDADTAAPEVAAAFEAWLAADAVHRRAWTTLSSAIDGALEPGLDRLRALRARAPEQAAALQAALISTPAVPPSGGRRRTMTTLAVLGAVGAVQFLDGDGWTIPGSAGMATGIGERRRVVLADGTRVTLNARSRIVPRFTGSDRGLDLAAGAVSIESIANDRTDFLVRAGPAAIAATSGRLIVERRDRRTRVAAVAGRFGVDSAAGAKRILQSPEVAWVDGRGIEIVQANAGAVAAWTEGLLDIADGTLGDVIAALRPYRRDVLRVSDRASALPVSGVFPLDDAARVLRVLESTLPIRVRHFGGWFTTIEART
ncbi:MAG: FecR family protein [Lautropia sp.]